VKKLREMDEFAGVECELELEVELGRWMVQVVSFAESGGCGSMGMG
jgi:hypothetical protein